MKVVKIVFIVIINIVLIAVLAEFACYSNEVFRNNPYFWYDKSFEEAYDWVKNDLLRKPVGLEYKNRPILLMGCSFAYGYGLDDNDNFGKKLSDYMKRPLYNRGFEWYWGPQTMLYQARREDFYKEIPNPEYVVYVFINHHVDRITSSIMEMFFRKPYLRYEMKNGRLEREKDSFIHNLFLYKKYMLHKLCNTPIDKKYESLPEYFIETKQEFDKHWKDYRFIILCYDENENTLQERLEHKAVFDKLKDNGFEVISTNDLTGITMNADPSYIIPGDNHPSRKAWELITPLFVKYIQHK